MIRNLIPGAAALALVTAVALPAAHADNMASTRASQVIGHTVTNLKDQKIGTVDDLLIAHDGHIDRAVLSVGGFLGIGDQLVAVPYGDLVLRGDALIVNVSADRLKTLPAFKYDVAMTEAGPHDSYLRGADARMHDWTERMANWKHSAKNASSDAGRKLSDAWATTKDKFVDLKDASAEGWDRAKANFDKAWHDLENAWKDATS